MNAIYGNFAVDVKNLTYTLKYVPNSSCYRLQTFKKLQKRPEKGLFYALNRLQANRYVREQLLI